MIKPEVMTRAPNLTKVLIEGRPELKSAEGLFTTTFFQDKNWPFAHYARLSSSEGAVTWLALPTPGRMCGGNILVESHPGARCARTIAVWSERHQEFLCTACATINP